MKKLLLFLALALIIAACDDKPTDPEKFEDIDLNLIKFTPESINLKPGFSYIIEFTGINFTKAKIDSIIIDNKKLEIIESSESKIISKIRKANPGTYQIELYQEGKVFILDKKILFIPMEYNEPTKDNIYFLPDTIFIDENNKSIQFTLYGTDFEKYKIEYFFLNSKKCNLKTYKDSLQVSYDYTMIGNLPINFYYKNKEIILEKPLVTIIKNSPLNLNIVNKCSIQCSNFTILKSIKYESIKENGNTKVSYDTVSEKLFLSTYSIKLNDAIFEFPYNFSYFDNNTGSNYKIKIDPEKSVIKYLEYTYRNYEATFDASRETKERIRLENLPYKIIDKNGYPQLIVEISGKDVDKYYPLFEIYSYTSIGNSSKYRTEIKTIPGQDKITGKQINYYPATDSSYIKITIGN